MDWTEIKVEIGVKDLDAAAAIANMTVPYGIYIEDYSSLEDEVSEIAHVDLIDEELLAQDRDKAKIHIYIDPEDNVDEAIEYLREHLIASGIPFGIDRQDVKEDDWLNNWRKYFKPMKVGEKLIINPSWYEDTPAEGRTILNIDPGLAFGTGKHETTRLCLELLEKYLHPGDEVLDVGCGSGILGIAAVLLGAKSAFGVDIDQMAVKTANENAVLNHTADRFVAVYGDLTEKVEGKYQLVVANIVADAIILLSESVSEFMNDDSVYIISGIIDVRVEDVKKAIRNRFDIMEEKIDGGWYAFALKLKQ